MTDLILLAAFVVIPITGADILLRILARKKPHWLHTTPPETEHNMTTEPRPDTCCGVCPPILGGGYDCTCEDNPRCTKGDTR